MKTIKIRNIWIGACIVFLGVLSFMTYGDKLITPDTVQTIDKAAQDKANQVGNHVDDDFEGVGETEIVQADKELTDILASANADKQTEAFFAGYRLERDRVRGQQLDTLTGIIENDKVDPSAKSAAQASIMKINESLSKELELESLLRAKDFEDAVVMINDTSVTVTVKAKSLDSEELAKITDLAARSTGCDLENIIVIPKE